MTITECISSVYLMNGPTAWGLRQVCARRLVLKKDTETYEDVSPHPLL